MRKIPKKNYYILIVLLIVTILITLGLSFIYLNKDKTVSDFYEYSNKITIDDFDQYMLENSDIIIYISDKYNLQNKEIEEKLRNKIEKLNLKQNFIYIEKMEINKKLINKMYKKYDINVNLKKLPILIVIVDNKLLRTSIINENSNLDEIIKAGDFE